MQASWLTPVSTMSMRGQAETGTPRAVRLVGLSVFTLGEVVRWFEDARHAKSVRQTNRASRWRPVLFVLGAIGLGLAGFVVLFSWCR